MTALDIPERHSRAGSPSVNPRPKKQVSTPVIRKSGPGAEITPVSQAAALTSSHGRLFILPAAWHVDVCGCLISVLKEQRVQKDKAHALMLMVKSFEVCHSQGRKAAALSGTTEVLKLQQITKKPNETNVLHKSPEAPRSQIWLEKMLFTCKYIKSYQINLDCIGWKESSLLRSILTVDVRQRPVAIVLIMTVAKVRVKGLWRNEVGDGRSA